MVLEPFSRPIFFSLLFSVRFLCLSKNMEKHRWPSFTQLFVLWIKAQHGRSISKSMANFQSNCLVCVCVSFSHIPDVGLCKRQVDTTNPADKTKESHSKCILIFKIGYYWRCNDPKECCWKPRRKGITPPKAIDEMMKSKTKIHFKHKRRKKYFSFCALFFLSKINIRINEQCSMNQWWKGQ